MKCKYCGGDVTLDDHFCPHCGRPVDQAQRHQIEMEQYETEFEETKKEALEKISVASGGGTAVGIRLAMIGVLLAALIFTLVHFDAYSVHERRERSAAKKNYDAYIAQMEEYLDNADYVTFHSFCRIHQLDYNDDFKQYRGIISAAVDYNNINRGLQELAFYDPSRTKSTDLYYVKSLSKSVNSFYEDTGRTYYLDKAEDPERYQAVIDGMEQDFLVMMQKYLGLTKEETDSMKGLSASKRTVMVEQALDRQLTKYAEQ